MKFILSLLFLQAGINFQCLAQVLNVHSITHNREPHLEAGGYTLDAAEMNTSGREKLLNLTNFGTGGIYPRPINIIDGFATSNSLTQVSSFPYNDLFFFGAFNKLEGTLVQFTNEEIDSLYNWSKRGGKLIIGGSATPDIYYDPSVLNSKWGFQIVQASPASFIPNSIGLNTDIFNGPFGQVNGANQGGGATGYFSVLPVNATVLATDINNHPTIIMDCTTLDLIVSDVDGYSSLSGSITAGPIITNNQDKYFANTFVFMDKLQAIPTINLNGFNLSTANIYNGYQWYKNDTLIIGSVGSSITINQQGQYYVEATLNGGCKVKSNTIITDSQLTINENVAPVNIIKIFPNPTQQTVNVSLPKEQTFSLSVLDITGRKIYERKNSNGIIIIDCSNFSSGIYFIQATNDENSLTYKLIRE